MDAKPPVAALTRRACLPSAGLSEARATEHEFVRFEEVDESSLRWFESGKSGKSRKCYALIYRCTETGAERRWGIW